MSRIEINEEQEISLNRIADYIKQELNIDVRLYKNSRKRELFEARTLFFVIAKQTTLISLEKLGYFLDKTHGSVLHSFKVWDTFLKNDLIDVYNAYFNIPNVSEDNEIVNRLFLENKELKAKLKLIENAGFKELLDNDNDIIEEFIITRLKPFISMLNNRI